MISEKGMPFIGGAREIPFTPVNIEDVISRIEVFLSALDGRRNEKGLVLLGDEEIRAVFEDGFTLAGYIYHVHQELDHAKRSGKSIDESRAQQLISLESTLNNIKDMMVELYTQYARVGNPASTS